MKIKDGFIQRKVPGMNLVMPTGKNVKELQQLADAKRHCGVHL